ncbi:nSTAND1 domain-containing NTPase [Streptomyces huasconensis]|uniref:nSTAND1 domain-containing NTPase n=1 Tax=Streptomyces huasconensis TaxID=1854574 RepID=UPI0033F59DC4
MGRREKPVEPTAGPVPRLAHDLRKLRVNAGSPTYRTMAEQAPYSAPTLSAAASGERLPTLPVLLAYVAACGGDPREWERRWYETVAEDAGRGTDEGDAPYPGLARFGTDDRERFHGRDDLVDELARLTARRRVTALIGASGSGKSSLLRAGLIPALREPGGPWRPASVRILTPGERPARTHRHLFTPADGDGDTLLVVDQFEELFSLCHDPAERDAFLTLLLTARDAASRLRVLLAVRADFYGRCAEHGPLAEALGDANLLVGPMPPARLREAIVRPAAAQRLVVERSLTARLVADVADEPGGLPLMAHALREVWRRRSGRTLTEAAYEAIGGVRGAVAHTAEEVYGRLSETETETARTLLLRMVAPGAGTQDTRRPVDRAELPPGCATVLERLVAARLLTVDEGVVDLAHEALITAWPRLRGWIEEDRERLRLHRALTEAAYTWMELERDPGALYRGARLTAAAEAFVANQRDGELTAGEEEFLMAGIDAHAQAVRTATRAARRTRALLSGLVALLCLAMVAGAVAWQQNENADRRSTEAQARRIAGVARTLRLSDPVTATRLSVAAWRLADLPETREAVRGAAAQRERDMFAGGDASERAAHFLSGDGRVLTSSTGRRVTRWGVPERRRLGTYDRPGPSGPADFDMDVSADGRFVAWATERGVQVWDVLRERPVGRPMREGRSAGMDARFAPSGRMLVLQRETPGEVQVWDVRRHRLVTTVRHVATSSSPYSAMSPDDRLLAACAGDDGPLVVRDISAGRDLPRRWPRALDQAFCTAQTATFTPDGQAVAVPVEGGIRTWDMRTGEERPEVDLPGAPEPSLDFSDDGTTAVALGKREVVLWRVADPGTPLLRHPIGEGTAREVRLDTEAGVIRVRTSARVVRALGIADVLSGRHRQRQLAGARFSPDGRSLATVERRGGTTVVRLRDAHDGTLLRSLPGRSCEGCPDPVLTFSPDGGTLAHTTGTERGTTVHRWSVRHGRAKARHTVASWVEDLVLPGGGGAPVIAGTEPGKQENDDRKVEVRRIDGRTDGHIDGRTDGRTDKRLFSRGSLGSPVLAPDGRALLTLDGRMTDLRTGRSTPVLRGEDSLITGAFSPDRRFLAVCDDNGRLTLWNGPGTRLLAVLSAGGPGEHRPASALSFSADGRHLAASTPDGSVRVWETGTPGLPGAEYPGADGAVLAVGFAGDELLIATAYGAVRGLPLSGERAAGIACRRAGGGLARGQWRTYLPNTPYRTTC